LGVVYTPVRDMEFGCHLNFRDPDNIALEIMSYNDVARSWLAELQERDVPPAELEARMSAYLASHAFG
jgi:hypothetical protein